VASLSRNWDREQLEREIQCREFQELLRGLQCKEPFLRQFETWSDVVTFMRRGLSRDPLKDGILRPILSAHADDQDPRWRTVLLLIFWPGLEGIYFKKYFWDRLHPDDLWSNIVWTFLEVVCRIDVKRRPERLVSKIANEVFHRLHDEYRRVWDRMARETNVEQEEFEALAGGVDDTGFAEVEFREQQEVEIRRFQNHMEEGRISEADFLLVVGSRVYGRSVADYAREAGLGYQVAKKRRQRAEAVIRQFEKKKR
jgi:hypothetical protein